MHPTRRRTPGTWLAGLALGGLAGLVLLSGCSSAGTGAAWHAAPHGQVQDQASATVSAPRDGATDQPTSTELTVSTSHVGSASVTLTDASGRRVPGALRVDGSSWVPDRQLGYGTTYTATVTATGASGQKITGSSTFSTMNRPGSTVGARTFLGDKQVVGVAAPLVVTFDHAVARDRRADVERRLFVTATPAQAGNWYWFSPTEVHYRPREHWQPGTRISLRAALGGLPLGEGRYGGSDLSLDLTVVDQALAITVDDATKTLTVTRDGVVVKTMPASLGKDSTPSSSGNMVVMSRETSAIFDSSTFGLPVTAPGGYRQTVQYPLRLTWGGQYIHSAPWSLADQGKDNVSHGCTNIAPENAQWLYEHTHVGDPVTVRHTIAGLSWGDGWTDWNRSWADYRAGSALPHGSTPYDYSAPGTGTPTPSPALG